MSDYASEFSIRRLWIIFGASMLVMFGALLFFGVQIYHAKPPIPSTVRSASGQVLYTGEDILRGQSVWQSTGGMPPSRRDLGPATRAPTSISGCQAARAGLPTINPAG